MRTAAVILAAGTSRRFGSPKQEAPIGDRTMLDVVCGIARSAGLSPVLVVAPTSVALAADVVRVTNDRPEEGMSASLRLGIGAVPDGVDEAVIMLGDQPMLTPATIRALVGADREGRHAVASMAGDVIGPPVLLERSLFYLVDQATGDEGLRTVLAGRSELMTPFVLDGPPVDVDTTDDLKRRIEVCPGCGAIFQPLPEIKPHEYLGASGACWSAFGELIAREFSDPAYGVVHRHTVDIYAAQHPGVDGRRQRQSVAVHLISLCAWLEHGLGPDALLPVTRRLADGQRDWPWLVPPSGYSVTVRDVLSATSGADHVAEVRSWAQVVWGAWAVHHATIRQWAGEAGIG